MTKLRSQGGVFAEPQMAWPRWSFCDWARKAAPGDVETGTRANRTGPDEIRRLNCAKVETRCW